MSVLLSVVIPVYNLALYIESSLKNLMMEMTDEVETIVVDDGSIDNSKELVLKYINKYPSYNFYFYCKDNGGVSSARNLGTRKANGKYILYLDGDDYLESGSLTKILQRIKRSESDIIFWSYRIVNEQGKRVGDDSFRIEKNYVDTGASAMLRLLEKRDLYLVIGNAAYKRDCCLQIYFSEGCVAGEDMEFTFKQIAIAKQIEFLQGACLNYVQRNKSAVHHYCIQRFDSINAIERAYFYIRKNAVGFSNDRFRILMIKEQLINFAGTYRMLAQQKAMENCIALSKAFGIVDLELEALYPGLRRKMYALYARNCKRVIWNKLFLFFGLSPKVYIYATCIKELKVRALVYLKKLVNNSEK